MMGYLGSKAASGAYQAIIASMPAHETYIETHLGGGAIMMRKPKAVRSIGLDIDAAVIEQWRGVSGIELFCGDAVAFLRGFDYESAGRVLVYADPPYLLETRTSRHRYRYEYSDDDHKVLLTLLVELAERGIAVMVSGYPSLLYDQFLSHWRTREFQVMTRGGVRTEKLWLSFPASSAHWVTFAGKNFTERQRIKRKAQRWAENYKKLDPSERLAVFAALLECDLPGSIVPSGYAGQHSPACLCQLTESHLTMPAARVASDYASAQSDMSLPAVIAAPSYAPEQEVSR